MGVSSTHQGQSALRLLPMLDVLFHHLWHQPSQRNSACQVPSLGDWFISTVQNIPEDLPPPGPCSPQADTVCQLRLTCQVNRLEQAMGTDHCHPEWGTVVEYVAQQGVGHLVTVVAQDSIRQGGLGW